MNRKNRITGNYCNIVFTDNLKDFIWSLNSMEKETGLFNYYGAPAIKWKIWHHFETFTSVGLEPLKSNISSFHERERERLKNEVKNVLEEGNKQKFKEVGDIQLLDHDKAEGPIVMEAGISNFLPFH